MAGQTVEQFEAEINDQGREDLENALALTSSSSGRLIASRFYDYFSQLKQVYRSNYQKDGQSEVNLALLVAAKNTLLSMAHQGTWEGWDDVDDEFSVRFNSIGANIQSVVKGEDSDAHLQRINRAIALSKGFYYLTVFANQATKVLQLLYQSLPILLRWIGKVFPQVIIALSAARNLIDFCYSLAIHSHLADKAGKEGASEELALTPTYDHGVTYRMAATALSLLINVITLLAFTGALLSSPIGWALTAIIAAADWVTNSVVPAWQAWKNYKLLQQEQAEWLPKRDGLIRDLIEARQREEAKGEAQSEAEIRRINHQINDLRGLEEKVRLAKIKYINKRNDALWGFCTVVGSALIAAGLLFPPLLIPGIVFLALSPARSLVPGIINKCRQWFGKGAPSPQSEGRPTPMDTPQIAQALDKGLSSASLSLSNPPLSGSLSQGPTSPAVVITPQAPGGFYNPNNKLITFRRATPIQKAPVPIQAFDPAPELRIP